MKTINDSTLGEQEIKDLKDKYYLDTQYCKFIVNYIDEAYPDYYNENDLGHLTQDKDYPLLFDGVVMAMNEFYSLYDNMPYQYQNRAGNEGIFKTTVLSYEEIVRQSLKKFIDNRLQTS